MTIYDIAYHFGVSAATVSLALNGKGQVAAQTRERIVAYALEHGFQRNEQARNFRLRRSNNIALVVHNIDNDFWNGVVKAIGDRLGEPYNVIVCNTDGDSDKERKIFNNLLQRKVDGIIVQPASREERLFEDIIHGGTPVVFLEETQNPLISFVKGNDFKGALDLTKSCIEAGHSRIALLSLKLDQIGLNQRILGFQQAVHSAGIGDQCQVFSLEDISYEAVEVALGNRLKDFTLVIGTDDRVACQLMTLLFQRGLRVPEDISVVGWNDSRFLEWCMPMLSSVSIPMRDIGVRCAEIILQATSGKGEVVKEFFEEKILFRKSFASFHS